MSNLYVFKTKKKNTALLIYNKKKLRCIVGKNGIGKKTREGDNITPQGEFRFLSVLYRPDKIQYLKTCIPKRKINKSSYWCVDPKSPRYNLMQKKETRFFSEKLYRSDNLYDVFITLNYNMNPTIKFKGSAIFMHCLNKKTEFTEGCLAVERKEIIEILKIITPSSKLIIY